MNLIILIITIIYKIYITYKINNIYLTLNEIRK